MQELKKRLRAELIARRREMAEKDRKISDEKIYNNLIKLPQLINAKTVLCYVSTPIEVDTHKLIKSCLSAGKTVAVPRCEGQKMRFFTISSMSELKTSVYGVPEPTGGEEVSAPPDAVCITPALSISMSGHRLGYGGGFYDRFFAENECLSVGLCYDSFIGEVPACEFDRKVGIIVTESEMITVTEIR